LWPSVSSVWRTVWWQRDSTHVTFLDLDGVSGILAAVGVDVELARSFPFPRVVGRLFKYNEFVTLGRRA